MAAQHGSPTAQAGRIGARHAGRRMLHVTFRNVLSGLS
jgi:hypothetical protein